MVGPRAKNMKMLQGILHLLAGPAGQPSHSQAGPPSFLQSERLGNFSLSETDTTFEQSENITGLQDYAICYRGSFIATYLIY